MVGYGTDAYGTGPYGSSPTATLPVITLTAGVLVFGERSNEGQLVRAVTIPWFEIMRIIERDPTIVYQIGDRKWEEIIAGAYVRAGWDEVVLTPRSGDGGKDVIATKKGVGAVRFYDQVKAYTPPRLVTADDVRSMLGVMTTEPNVSKAIITTTSDFAPGVYKNPGLAALMPFRFELRSGGDLLKWLADLSSSGPSEVGPL